MKMLKRCLIMPVMMFTVCAEEVVHNEVKSMPPTNVNGGSCKTPSAFAVGVKFSEARNTRSLQAH